MPEVMERKQIKYRTNNSYRSSKRAKNRFNITKINWTRSIKNNTFKYGT